MTQPDHSRKRTATAADLPSDSPARFRRDQRGRRVLNQYLDLLNQEIADANNLATLDVRRSDIHTFHESQFGVVTWTAVEKSAFFAALTRFGRLHLDLVAEATGKSVPEVTQYLHLLDQNSARRGTVFQRKVTEERDSDPEISDADEVESEHEAAMEISPDCDTMLETIADKVEIRETERATRKEKDEWGEDWVVTWEVAERLEQAVKQRLQSEPQTPSRRRSRGTRNESHDSMNRESDEASKTQDREVDLPPNTIHPKLISAAHLLNATNLLELSSRLFMNPGPPLLDQNWFFHRTDTAPFPSLFANAFTDLYNLTVLMTRRLVSATLFEANSRCRAVGVARYKAKPKVKKGDVLTARRVLRWDEGIMKGMGQTKPENEQNPESDLWNRYWQTLPRRQGLKVHDVNTRTRWGRAWGIAWRTKHRLGQPLSYDVVERRLGRDAERNDSDDEADGQEAKADRRDVKKRRKLMKVSAGEDDGYGSSDDSSDISSSDTSHSEKEDENQAPTNKLTLALNDNLYQSSGRSASQSASDEEDYLDDSSTNNEDINEYAQSDETLALDTAMDTTDLRLSHREEYRLWRLMGHEPPSNLADVTGTAHSLPPLPTSSRSAPYQAGTGQEEAWREWCDYRAEWERYGHVVDEE